MKRISIYIFVVLASLSLIIQSNASESMKNTCDSLTLRMSNAILCISKDYNKVEIQTNIQGTVPYIYFEHRDQQFFWRINKQTSILYPEFFFRKNDFKADEYFKNGEQYYKTIFQDRANLTLAEINKSTVKEMNADWINVITSNNEQPTLDRLGYPYYRSIVQIFKRDLAYIEIEIFARKDVDVKKTVTDQFSKILFFRPDLEMINFGTRMSPKQSFIYHGKFSFLNEPNALQKDSIGFAEFKVKRKR